MKAKAGFLMLLIGLMSFTGFGFTTADLNQDSTADIVQLDQDTSVIVVFESAETVVENKYLAAARVAAEQTDIELATRYHALFEEAEAAFNKAYRSDLDDLEPDLDLPEQLTPKTNLPDPPLLSGDVGWISAELYHRNPRDGITYTAFFLFYN